MKTFLLCIALLCTTLGSQAQTQSGDVFAGARLGYLTLDGFNPRVYGGADLEVMVSDKIGIQYSFLGGKEYFHMPLAPFGGLFVGLAIGSTENDSTGKRNVGAGILFGLLTAIIPEGVSYNIPLESMNSSIAPYISPLQFEYIKSPSQSGGQDSYAGGAVGLRYNYFLGRIRLSLNAEYKIHYHNPVHGGISAGFGLGYNLSSQ